MAEPAIPLYTMLLILLHQHLTVVALCVWLGIEGEVVRAVAASRYFSILATATGEIWSFGGGFNGELGFRNTSWVTSAQKVEGQLAQVCIPLHVEVLWPAAQQRHNRQNYACAHANSVHYPDLAWCLHSCTWHL